jgi:hypothetical protein
MYIDRDLAPGVRWDPAILRWIDDADAFQLYWSQFAAGSEYVQKEWQYALTLEGTKGDLFIRPLYWQEGLPELPPSLAHKNFYRLDLAVLRGAETSPPSEHEAAIEVTPPVNPGSGDSTALEPDESTDNQRARAISATAIPLLPNAPRSEAALVRADIANAVAFLEGTTGLRYYPVPTLLVDAFAVQSVRTVQQTVDLPPDDELLPRIDAYRDVLQSLLLDFHSGYVPPMQGQNASAPVFEGYSPEASKGLREFAEWGVSRWVVCRFNPPWQERTVDQTWRQARDYLFEYGVEEMHPNLGYVPFLEAYFHLMSRLIRDSVGEASAEPWDNHYSIKQASWTLIDAERPNPNIRAEAKDAWDGPMITLRGAYRDVIQLLDHCGEALCRALGQLPCAAAQPLAQAVVESSVFGIFMPGNGAADGTLLEWAARNQVPQQTTLPGTPRVLSCLNAFDGDIDRQQTVPVSPVLRRALARCVQVHEHFHAVLETGLDEHGDPASGPSRNSISWRKATPLNESLAAWMELRFAQKHAVRLGLEDTNALTDAIWAYIRSGPYPQWPYRGAEYVEARYRKEGIASVRRMLRLLRDDPETAQQEFDTHWRTP